MDKTLTPETKLAFDAKEICIFDFIGSGSAIASGAISYLQMIGAIQNIKWIAASSASSVHAAIVMSYTGVKNIKDFYTDMLIKVQPTDINNIRVTDIFRLLTKGYVAKDDSVSHRDAVRYGFEYLLLLGSGNSNVTFREHYQQTGKILIFVLTDYNSGSIAYTCYLTTPDMRIADAAAAAFNPTFFFSPRLLSLNPGSKPRYYTEGFIGNSFPIDLFQKRCSRYYLGYYVLPEFKDYPIPELTPRNFLGITISSQFLGDAITYIFNGIFGVNFLSSRKQNRPIWETYYNLIQIGRRSQNIKLTKEIKTQIMSLELLTQPLTQDIPTNLNEYLTYFSQGYEAARIQVVYYNRSGNFL